MFKISPASNESERRTAADACGVPLIDGSFIYRMTDAEDGHLLGMSQFEITASGGVLYHLREIPDGHDFEAMFILGRATMNFVDLCGTHTMRAASAASDGSLLRALGFKEFDGSLIADLTGMFDGHCGGHK